MTFISFSAFNDAIIRELPLTLLQIRNFSFIAVTGGSVQFGHHDSLGSILALFRFGFLGLQQLVAPLMKNQTGCDQNDALLLHGQAMDLDFVKMRELSRQGTILDD